MSTPAQILAALETQLKNATGLSYILNVFLGTRERLVNFPAIVLEYLGSDEEDETHATQQLYFRAAVFFSLKVFDEAKQLVGAGDLKGQLDIENDIKKAIGADRTLGGTAHWVRFGASGTDLNNFPVRLGMLELIIEYRQKDSVRT